MNIALDDDRAVGDLVFRAGKTGFVFYDDCGPFSNRGNQLTRTWAFSTIDEAATWLHNQFRVIEDDGKREPEACVAVVRTSADRVRSIVRHAPAEGRADALLIDSLRTFNDDTKVDLYVGDVRLALGVAAVEGTGRPSSTRTRLAPGEVDRSRVRT